MIIIREKKVVSDQIKGMFHNVSAGIITYHNTLSEEHVAVFCMAQAKINVRMRHAKSVICPSVCV